MSSSQKFLVWSVAVLLAVLATPHNAEEEVPTIFKRIHLDEFTPQAIVHLPLNNVEVVPGKDYTCHLWVSFLDQIPFDTHFNYKNYGISVLELGKPFSYNGNGTYLELSTWIVKDENGTLERTGKSEWKDGSHNIREMRENRSNFCIKMVGNWTNTNSTKADLLLTFYYEIGLVSEPEFYCPKGMHRCAYSHCSDTRCISDDLFCNGVPNCGTGTCYLDEKPTNEVKTCPSDSVYDPEHKCVWTDFEYLLMMIMTGFLLILIPVVFLLTMMYHRRTTSAMNFEDYDNNNNVPRHGQCPHVISTLPVMHVDEPPSYDDLPDELKMPPGTRTQVVVSVPQEGDT